MTTKTLKTKNIKKNIKNKKTFRKKKTSNKTKTSRNIKIVHSRQNNNRSKKGGLFSIFFKKGPSPEETNDFINRFTTHINDIIRHQQSKKQQKLYEKVNETIEYINNISNNVDKNIRINNAHSDIRGLPIYIIGRVVERKTQRDKLIDSLKKKGFRFNETVLDAVVKKAEQSRNNNVPINPPQKQESIKNKNPTVEVQQTVREINPKNSEQLQNILKEKRAREIEEKRLFDEEQKRIRQDIENRKNQIKTAEENKKKELKKREESNIATIKKQQKENENKIRVLPKIESLIVRSLKPTPADMKEEKQNIAEIKEAEDNDENLKMLMVDEQNATTIVIQDAPTEEPTIDTLKRAELIEVPSATITMIKHEPYETDRIPQYWLKYFPHNMLYALRDFMLSMLLNPSYLYDITSIFFPALRINKQDNRYISSLQSDKKIPLNAKDYYIEIYENHLQTSIRFILLYIGIISNVLLHLEQCYLILKGGKAIQMNCSTPYESNDIDILIVSNNDNVNKKELAIEISKLLLWMTTQQNIIKQMSMIEVVKLESLIKISMLTEYGFQALVDIGYHIPKEEVQSYFEISKLFISNVYSLPFTYMLNDQPLFITYHVCFISQSIEQMIKEKIYLYIKYAVLQNYTVEDNAEFFIPKIRKSLGQLLNCNNTNISNRNISRIVYDVKTEKETYLKGITEIQTKEIVDEIINIMLKNKK